MLNRFRVAQQTCSESGVPRRNEFQRKTEPSATAKFDTIEQHKPIH
jgi:hypothetical protein